MLPAPMPRSARVDMNGVSPGWKGGQAQMEAAENGLLRKAGRTRFDMFIWLSYKLLRSVLLRVNPRVPVRAEGG